MVSLLAKKPARKRGGELGKSHSSYDYDGMWKSMGSGASSGGRKKAGSYSGGYVEDIHEMDIHHGAGRQKKRVGGVPSGGVRKRRAGAYSGGVPSGGVRKRAGVLIGGRNKKGVVPKALKPWLSFLAAFRKKYKSKYVGDPHGLVKDAAVMYRKRK